MASATARHDVYCRRVTPFTALNPCQGNEGFPLAFLKESRDGNRRLTCMPQCAAKTVDHTVLKIP